MFNAIVPFFARHLEAPATTEGQPVRLPLRSARVPTILTHVGIRGWPFPSAGSNPCSSANLGFGRLRPYPTRSIQGITGAPTAWRTVRGAGGRLLNRFWSPELLLLLVLVVVTLAVLLLLLLLFCAVIASALPARRYRHPDAVERAAHTWLERCGGGGAPPTKPLSGATRARLVAMSPRALKQQCRDRGLVLTGLLEKKEFVDALERFVGAFRPHDDRSVLVDYAAARQDTFAQLNRVRQDPRLLIPVIEAYIRGFDADGMHRQCEIGPGRFAVQASHEGVAACREALAHLRTQRAVPPLRYSHVLERAATDHVLDQGPVAVAGHAGTNGSHPKDRIERYGAILTTMGEVCSYSQHTDGLALIMGGSPPSLHCSSPSWHLSLTCIRM